jgi:hypothetical protein
MRQYLITFGVLLTIWSGVCLADTQATFVINNNSSYDLNKTETSSYSMKKWNFPQVVSKQQSVSTLTEFEEHWYRDPCDDFGKTVYTVNCPMGQQNITIKLSVSEHFDALINPVTGVYHLSNFSAETSGASCVILQPTGNIGYNENGNNVLTLIDQPINDTPVNPINTPSNQ